MDAILDTVIWLANFPATHGYAMVFIAAFASMGLLVRSFRRPGGPRRLRQLREAAGQEPTRDAVRAVRDGWEAGFFRVLAVVVLAGGVIGVTSLILGPVTSGYIHANGASAEGVLDGDYVTFTAADGVSYTLPFDFFSEPVAPDSDAFVSDGPVAVRYLEAHPQAYVVDTERTDHF